jgi:hypothetical protein
VSCCVGWVVVTPCYSTHDYLVSPVPVSGVIVSCSLSCVLLFVVCGVVKPLSLLPSCLIIIKKENEKKKSPVAVTKGTLHMVSEKVQPCDCGSTCFPLQ